MRNNFVGIEGEISRVIRSSPNGLETNSLALFNFLSNLIYYGIANTNIYQNLLQMTSGSNLLESLFNIAQNPFNAVEDIYNLISTEAQIYSPSLPDLDLSSRENPSPIPNQWTLTIKVNDSGSKNFLIGGTGYIVFDENDRAWVSNNVRQGTGNSSTWCMVLESDGSPAAFSPIFGNDLFGGGGYYVKCRW